MPDEEGHVDFFASISEISHFGAVDTDLDDESDVADGQAQVGGLDAVGDSADFRPADVIIAGS